MRDVREARKRSNEDNPSEGLLQMKRNKSENDLSVFANNLFPSADRSSRVKFYF
jgi:hypothetical protein